MTCSSCGWHPLENIKRKLWEIVDVNEAHVYHASSVEERDAFMNAVDLMNHRVMVREVIV